MDNIQAIKKEAMRQKKIRTERAKEWRSIEAMKNLDNTIAVSFLVKSGMDEQHAKQRVFNDSLGDDQAFQREAYLHIKEREKEKRKMLKSLTEDKK
jgi:hypothetical protein